jgi:hypothetical protein
MQNAGHSSDDDFSGLTGLSNVQAKALLTTLALTQAELAQSNLTAAWQNGQHALPARAGDIIDHALKLQAAARLQAPIWNDYTSAAIGDAVLQVRESLWLAPEREPVKLTEKERDLLMVLYLAPNRQADREELLAKVWGYRADLETHTLETHIYRLRQKIENNAEQPAILLTIPNGYALA